MTYYDVIGFHFPNFIPHDFVSQLSRFDCRSHCLFFVSYSASQTLPFLSLTAAIGSVRQVDPVYLGEVAEINSPPGINPELRSRTRVPGPLTIGVAVHCSAWSRPERRPGLHCSSMQGEVSCGHRNHHILHQETFLVRSQTS